MYRLILVVTFFVGTFAGVLHPRRQTNSIELPQGSRIVGGEPTTIQNVPYIVAILYYSGLRGCGGSIIKIDTILTAAHCLEELPPSGVSIRVGSTYKSSGGQVINLRSFVIHPDNNPSNYDNDIAVIKLSSSITLSNSARVIQMIGQNQAVADGSMSRVSGWGITKPDDISTLQETLHTVLVPTVSNARCNVAYEGRIKDNMLCAGYLGEGGKDACQNDSGGPLVFNNMLIGVVSWGRECATAQYPGVYAKVSYFTNWINSK